MAKFPPMADLHLLPEDERITVIGTTIMNTPVGKTIGVCVDDDTLDPGKGDRYIEKVCKQFPKIVLYKRGPGPVAGVESLIFKRSE